jgi:hypothetical protein
MIISGLRRWYISMQLRCEWYVILNWPVHCVTVFGFEYNSACSFILFPPHLPRFWHQRWMSMVGGYNGYYFEHIEHPGTGQRCAATVSFNFAQRLTGWVGSSVPRCLLSMTNDLLPFSVYFKDYICSSTTAHYISLNTLVTYSLASLWGSRNIKLPAMVHHFLLYIRKNDDLFLLSPF